MSSSTTLADSGKSCPCVKDPVNPSTGGEYQAIVDVPATGPAQSLAFVRHYNSLDTASTDMGPGWRHTFSRKLVLDALITQYDANSPDYSALQTDQATACTVGWSQIRNRAGQPNTTASYSNGTCSVSSQNGRPLSTITVYSTDLLPSTSDLPNLVRDDGHILHFGRNGGSFVAEQGVPDRLSYSGDGGYTLVDADDNVETYDIYGKLLTLTDRAGNTQTMAYSNGLLTSVRDNFGHALSLNYDSQSRLQTVTGPDGVVRTYSYGSNGRLAAMQHQDGTQRKYFYADPNWANGLSSVVDENGATVTTWTYDAQGRVTSEQEAGGVDAVSLTYNANGSTTTTDAFAAVRNFTFQQIGGHLRSAAVTGAPCVSCGYDSATTYGAGGFIASRTDYNGNVTTYVYDNARGLEISRTEAYGTPQARTITTAWHSNLRLPAQIDEPGRRTTFGYDSAGNLQTRSVTDTNSNTTRSWTYTYNSHGQMLTVDGPRTDLNDITTITYNECSTGNQCGQINTIKDALGHVTTFNTYDANGRPLKITDPNGLVITLTYSPRGWLTSRKLGTELTTYDHDNAGQLTKVTLPNGAFLAYRYDDAHRLYQITDQLGDKIVYTLDAMGNHTADNVYDPSGTLTQTHTRVINTLNQLYQDIGAQHQTTTLGYDDNGNLTGVDDPLHHATSKRYDALNRVTQVTDPISGVTQYAYNALDQLTAVTDPRSLITRYTVDGLGNNTQTASPDAGTAVSTFDAAGNALTRKDAKGQTTTYQYDALNRLAKITYADNTTVSFSYDQSANGIGHLTTMTDNSGATAWQYDPHGRVTQKSQTSGGVTLVTQYAYDSLGQLTDMTLPSGRGMRYSYTNGQLSGVVWLSTGAAQNNYNLVKKIAYQPFGGLISMTWGNGEVVNRAYDLDGRLSTYSLGSMGYDDASRITHLTLGNRSVVSGSKTYGYDALDRLTSYADATSTLGYSYDANGNRTFQSGSSSVSGSSPALNYNIDYGSNRIASATSGVTTISPSYDANGSTTKDVHNNTLSYDTAGRLAHVSAPNASATGTYAYNGLGQRVQKNTETEADVRNLWSGSNGRPLDAQGLRAQLDYISALLSNFFKKLPLPVSPSYYIKATTVFAYDEAGHLIGEYDGNGNLIEETVWLGDLPLAVLQPQSAFPFFIHADHLNTPRQIDNQYGQAVWTWDPITFGGSTPTQYNTATGAGFVYNLRFAGQYFDQESGLSDNGYRPYDGQLGRYTQSDPIGLGGGINTYAYAYGNPISDVDPTGLGELTKNILPGAPSTKTCIGDGENCATRAQKGIAQCIVARGGVTMAQTCGQEWHAWATDCEIDGAPHCDEKPKLSSPPVMKDLQCPAP
jgi:RHS repeat-associated protein